MDNIFNNQYLIHILESIAYLGMAFILFAIGKLVYGIARPKIRVREELVDKDNFSFSIAHTGYFAGLLAAIGGAVMGPSNGIWVDLFEIFVYGLLAIVLMNISIWINDKIILNKFSVVKEIIEDRNEGAGVVEGAMALSAGLIVMGALEGESISVVHGLTSACGFWVLGQFVLIAVAKIASKISTYNIQEQIEKDNVAVGIGFGGVIVAAGNLVRYAIQGEFTTWGDTIFFVFFYILIGFILLPITRYLCDKILLPGKSLTDEIINQENPNIGAALIEAFAYIGSSILITWSL